MRPAIALLLPALLMASGCDTQGDAPEQAEAVSAPATPTASGSAGDAQVEEIGTLDRSHAGEIAPDVAFEDPAGRAVTLADFRGTPVLLNLWATWCAPCVAEMPTLDELAIREGDALKVLTVSQDLQGAEKVDPFFEEAGFERIEPYLDPEVLLSAHYASNLPTTILYDSQGREVWRMLGGMDWTNAAAAELIGEAR
ncbi:TlpA family protein disulfide reductase [Sphingosinithalassobacter sp. CS137]|uniref:TlpA family protein disulfide reductase n=1 Tax=Sphingosinithalassobacter sp. CS137 TaxID=2762748 RepID=UPI0021D0E232|nr:TlpA disulfide reductase family protein [Sphingosinithalassobacter sp. CS137]